ncbi:MAG: hypothetical protein GYB27_24645 [Rhodobacteraceae bacterium]|nr:hypothetical protein [Paracoccaceae bacterium]
MNPRLTATLPLINSVSSKGVFETILNFARNSSPLHDVKTTGYSAELPIDRNDLTSVMDSDLSPNTLLVTIRSVLINGSTVAEVRRKALKADDAYVCRRSGSLSAALA